MVTNFGRRLPMDSRMVREIAGDSRMAAEQGPDWLSEWGGPQGYRYWARQPVADRMTYFAVTEGYDTPESISAVTDLSVGDVNRSLSKLRGEGRIEAGVVSE